MIQFTSKERKALVFLAVIISLGLFVQWLLPHKVKSDQYDYTMQDSLFKALAADTISESQPIEYPTAPKQKPPKRSKKKNLLLPKSINVNSDGQKELEKLPGIGPKTAQAIIIYREQNGPFTKLEQLKNVKRIGPKTLQKISPFIYLNKEVNVQHKTDSLKNPVTDQ